MRDGYKQLPYLYPTLAGEDDQRAAAPATPGISAY